MSHRRPVRLVRKSLPPNIAALSRNVPWCIPMYETTLGCLTEHKSCLSRQLSISNARTQTIPTLSHLKCRIVWTSAIITSESLFRTYTQQINEVRERLRYAVWCQGQCACLRCTVSFHKFSAPHCAEVSSTQDFVSHLERPFFDEIHRFIIGIVHGTQRASSL